MSASVALPNISSALPEDAELIHELATEAGIDAWSAADYVTEMGRKDSVVFVSHSGPFEISGFLVARIVPGQKEQPDADLYNIAVRRGQRGLGIGGKLLKALFSIAHKREVENIWLEVRASNFVAINFYEWYGFRAELTRPNFYANPTEDAVIMRLTMEHSADSAETNKA